MTGLKLEPMTTLTLALIGGVVLFPRAVFAGADSTGTTGSVTVTRHVNAASRAFASRDYKKARDEYRFAIGLCPDHLEFYYGLYDVCVHSGDWPQVVFALDKIFELDPGKKKQLGAQYGEALYHLRRYDEAIPVIKQALKDADLPLPKISLVVPPPQPEPDTAPEPKAGSTAGASPDASSTAGSGQPPVQVAVLPPPIPKEPPAPVNVNEGTLGNLSKSFENAVRSECIVVAEYHGYEHSGDITFYHPPQANYRIVKILKGPPLNKDLPIRYEFHDRSKAAAPKDWKFGPDKMPGKGSEWIIFIMNAVPRDRMFDTYQGCYGRQPATEENLNQVYALIEGSSNR